jgi:ATPase subunit of ABC transporter with duplicated ATPase domains
MISTANITMQFGDKPLFEDISVNFGDGNRYGLIGANGSGKSTFMRILEGLLEPTAGNVVTSPNERIGKLNQDQFAYEEFNVVDTVIMGYQELWKVKQERDRIYGLPEMSEEEGMKVADLEIEFAEMDGYTAESRAGELLMGVGIPIELHLGTMAQVAPGLKLRVLLAQALFSDPDILMLDEPTNNLDIHTIRWLEKVLQERRSTMIIISHDRHFLNSVCTHMADLDYGDIKLFPGNYDEYMTAATMVRERMQSENSKKKAQIAELKAFVSRFSANASKAKQATSRARLIDKIQLDEIKPSSRVNPFIRFNQDKKLFRNAIEVEGLCMAYDETLYENQSFNIEVGERVAVIGQNGAGKTTLIQNLLSAVTPTAGDVKWSENSEIGYYAQDHAADFEDKMTVYEWMYQWRKNAEDEQFVRGVLGQLLFSKDDIKKSVKVLSGGEKGRMLFGKIMMQRPNIIVMDEPTNHLDMESIESLNLALDNFDGTLIFVTHDREFVSSLATQVFEIDNKSITHFVGPYDAYLAVKDQQVA